MKFEIIRKHFSAKRSTQCLGSILFKSIDLFTFDIFKLEFGLSIILCSLFLKTKVYIYTFWFFLRFKLCYHRYSLIRLVLLTSGSVNSFFMQHLQTSIETYNAKLVQRHRQKTEMAKNLLELNDSSFETLVGKIQAFQTAIPSWALGTGGTRFGRFCGISSRTQNLPSG